MHLSLFLSFFLSYSFICLSRMEWLLAVYEKQCKRISCSTTNINSMFKKHKLSKSRFLNDVILLWYS
ncbi:hypothetical protein XENTR_v10013928 [Xenopus tropicalis]|nr:hypothetical protein XENTR_v10013928 [Xenopus tropicalis]